MQKGGRRITDDGNTDRVWKTAIYCRLSREDGDKPESDSIGNQKSLLTGFAAGHSELRIAGVYVDDGCTGTNFDRPSFQRMLADIEAGRIDCVLVKDLSRFGRDYIEAGRYLERWMPEHGVRFIALGDSIDSERGSYDMMLPLKNLFNAQYARDISEKVKSAMRAKQDRGDFIGAFACYGYMKDPENKNHLIVDPAAAPVVRRIFDLFDQGTGKIRIAKILNAENVPCPSEYKRLMGERYCNNHRLVSTDYWTYATVHRILKSETYIGNMEQGRDSRLQMHGAAKRKSRAEWTIVKGTHEPIISADQWNRVQAALNCGGRRPAFEENVSIFAGFLKCGDCGRSMARTAWKGKAFYTCGSYKRYGETACTRHYITQSVLENAVLSDLNKVIESVEDLPALVTSGEQESDRSADIRGEQEKLGGALARVRRLRQSAYEDYRDKLISKEDFLRYRDDYEMQEKALKNQLAGLDKRQKSGDRDNCSWAKSLLADGRITGLDRQTIAETIKEIKIFEGGRIEITYLFSEEMSALLECDDGTFSH
jgi:site-specific DNA recombinase